MGAYVFSHATAIAIMRYMPTQVRAARKTEIDLREATCSTGELKERGWMQWLNGTAHLLVDASNARRHSAFVETHRWGAQCHFWPVLQLGDDIYMSSLEFIFLQAANQLDELALVFLGCEICGIYYYDAAGDIRKRKQLCSKESIDRFLQEHHDARGAKKARKALRFVLDGSGSPMETALALRLTLPCKLGGRGIAAPELNQGIPLGPVATMAFGRDRITPDLLWQKHKLAIEYESDEFHTGADRIVNDSRRRLALEATGYDVITVTNEQMRNARDFDAIAEHVAQKTKKRKAEPNSKRESAQALLGHRLHRLATDPGLTSCAR